MCVHPCLNKLKTPSELNKLTEDLNNTHNDLDSVSEFSGFCRYIDCMQDLQCNRTDLTFMHWNAHSIISKQQDLSQILRINNVDICTLDETWLKKSNRNLVNFLDYSFVSCECKGNCKGGGVGILVSSHLKYKHRLDIETSFDDLDLCAVEIKGMQKNIVILSLYRAPNTNDTNFMQSYKLLLDKLQSERKHLIIGSDYNYDLLKSSLHKQTQKFLDNTLASDM